MFSTHAFVQIQGNARRQKESMNHQSLMPTLASLGKIDPSDFFLGCENEGLKLFFWRSCYARFSLSRKDCLLHPKEPR